MKHYLATAELAFQVDPPNDNTWIPVGFGRFKAAISPAREEFLLKIRAIRILDEPKPAHTSPESEG